MPVGVDSSDIFELYLQDASEINVYVIGYWLTSEAEFLTNAQDVTPGSASTWTNTDLSSYFTDTVLAGLLFVHAEGGGASFGGFQGVNGGDRYGYLGAGADGGGIAPCTNEVCETYTGSTSVKKIYCVGAVTANFTAVTEDSHTPGGTTWEDNDLSGVVSADAVAVCVQTHDGTNEDYEFEYGYRPNGETSDNHLLRSPLGFEIHPINTSDRILEVKANTNVNVYTIAYMTEPAAASTPISAIAHHHRMLQGVG